MKINKLNELIENNSKWSPLKKHIDRINYSDNVLALENCKALIESILKTIIYEITDEVINNVTINNLFRQVRDLLEFKDELYEHTISTFLNKMANLRNNIGDTSHGRTIYQLADTSTNIEDIELQFIFEMTDSIACFLINYYESKFKDISQHHFSYEDYSDFNEWLDNYLGDVQLEDYTFSASEILYYLDMQAYKEKLVVYKEIEALSEKLLQSHSFAQTHELIRQLLFYPYDLYSKEIINNIVEALFNNDQVSSILQDQDIREFYIGLLNYAKDFIKPEYFDRLKDIYEL